MCGGHAPIGPKLWLSVDESDRGMNPRELVVARTGDGTLAYHAHVGSFVATIVSVDADQQVDGSPVRRPSISGDASFALHFSPAYFPPKEKGWG